MTLTGAYKGKPRRKVKCLVFDLDDCLYQSAGVHKQVVQGIHGYMIKHLQYTTENVAEKATELYITHGTSLAGLVAAGCKIDFAHWHKEVHYGHIDYELHIQPDPELREILFAIDLPKYVFTNADVQHASICLRRLGIEDCFQGVFHFEFLDQAAQAAGLVGADQPCIVCKPSHAAYDLVFKQIGVNADEVVFFDDSPRNIKAAHELGVMTVMVGTDQAMPGADISILNLRQLPRVLPELLDHPGVVKEVAAGQEHEHMVTVSAS